MVYAADEPGSFHMDDPEAGTPLLRYAISLVNARPFEVSPIKYTPSMLARAAEMGETLYITQLPRADGGGAIAMLPEAYIQKGAHSTSGARVQHRAGEGDGPSATLVVEFKDDEAETGRGERESVAVVLPPASGGCLQGWRALGRAPGGPPTRDGLWAHRVHPRAVPDRLGPDHVPVRTAHGALPHRAPFY